MPIKVAKSKGQSKAFIVNHSDKASNVLKVIEKAGFKKIKEWEESPLSSRHKHKDGTVLHLGHRQDPDNKNHYPVYFKVPKKKGK